MITRMSYMGVAKCSNSNSISCTLPASCQSLKVKNCILLLQEQGLFHSTLPESSMIHVSTAEKKLLIVFIYYILLYVISLFGLSLGIQIADDLQTNLLSYFICEQNGHDPTAPCDRSGFESLHNQGILLLSYILAFLAPAVNFVFVVDYQELKQKFKKKNPPGRM